MRGSPARVGEEFRVGCVVPKGLLGFPGTERIEDADPEPDAVREIYRPTKRFRGVAMQVARRPRVNRPSGEVAIGRVGDVERDFERLRRDLYQGHAARPRI